MATEKQTEANRLNAQKSTGPRTEPGKSRSRLNAFRHGLTGQLDIMPEELREAHDTFIASIVLTLKPADDLENQIAHSIAESYWRLNRIPVVENALLAQGDFALAPENQDIAYSDLQRALSSVRAFIDDPARFGLLTVYEMRLHRKAQSELKQLREIQAGRSAVAPAILSPVVLHNQSQPQGFPRDPKAAPAQTEPHARPEPPKAAAAQPPESTGFPPENGFVFSDASCQVIESGPSDLDSSISIASRREFAVLTAESRPIS